MGSFKFNPQVKENGIRETSVCCTIHFKQNLQKEFVISLKGKCKISKQGQGIYCGVSLFEKAEGGLQMKKRREHLVNSETSYSAANSSGRVYALFR
jgi:hypothetical protein